MVHKSFTGNNGFLGGIATPCTFNFSTNQKVAIRIFLKGYIGKDGSAIDC
jgi:hypothetical protein